VTDAVDVSSNQKLDADERFDDQVPIDELPSQPRRSDIETDEDCDRLGGVFVEVQTEADQVELLESLAAQGLPAPALRSTP
jgi:hypothetical protein